MPQLRCFASPAGKFSRRYDLDRRRAMRFWIVLERHCVVALGALLVLTRNVSNNADRASWSGCNRCATPLFRDKLIFDDPRVKKFCMFVMSQGDVTHIPYFALPLLPPASRGNTDRPFARDASRISFIMSGPAEIFRAMRNHVRGKRPFYS